MYIYLTEQTCKSFSCYNISLIGIFRQSRNLKRFFVPFLLVYPVYFSVFYHKKIPSNIQNCLCIYNRVTLNILVCLFSQF
jgi:hypothetical protein